MNSNVSSLKIACEQKGLQFEVVHPSGNAVRVWKENRAHYFVNWTTPLNSQAEAFLCKDKDYTYHLLAGTIEMPRSMSFLNPDCDERYKNYVLFESVPEIATSALGSLAFPIVVKPNQGSGGKGVETANTRSQLEQAIAAVFEQSNLFSDYLVQVQQFVDIAVEYRAVFVNQELVLLYEKPPIEIGLTGAAASRWQDGTAKITYDQTIHNRISSFCSPIFEVIPIRFCGLDVARDTSGKLHLLEMNSSPGFDHIIRDTGYDAVAPVYAAILDSL